MLAESITRDFPDYVKSMDQVVHLTAAAGPEECNEVSDCINKDAGEVNAHEGSPEEVEPRQQENAGFAKTKITLQEHVR